jgi:hypothetical protein
MRQYDETVACALMPPRVVLRILLAVFSAEAPAIVVIR